MEYSFKRLVDGLAHTREAARPGFSLALGQVSPLHPSGDVCSLDPARSSRCGGIDADSVCQVLNAFEDVPLHGLLARIREKHNLQTVKKVSRSRTRRLFHSSLGFVCPRSQRKPEPGLRTASTLADPTNLLPFPQNLFRNALFGNYFGVLALQQSGRLSKVSGISSCPSAPLQVQPGCLSCLQERTCVQSSPFF